MKGQTIRDLAEELDVEVDDVLLALWECGLTDYSAGGDLVYTRESAAVRQALGLPKPSQTNSPDYWRDVLQLSTRQFHELLRSLGIKMKPGARRLPKGSIKKIRAHVRGTERELTPECRPERSASSVAPQPFQWVVVGHQAPRSYLDSEEVEQIHLAIAEDFKELDDPIYPAGIREQGLLDSAVSRPQTALGGQLKYETVEMAGAALLHSLVHNHPFHNGNKRTAIVSLIVFLDENRCYLTCNEGDLFRFVLLIARHAIVEEKDSWLADREVVAAAQWLRANSRAVDTDERQLKWWRLKRNLKQFDCTFAHPGGVGNRITIYRTVTRRGLFGTTKTVQLSIQVACRGDSTDADRDVVAAVRKALELTPQFGIDSVIFYGPRADLIDEWIDNYRGLLRRLASL